MLIEVGTFVVVLFIIVGAYWLFVVRSENRTQTNLQRRLRTDPALRAAQIDVLKIPHRLSAIPAVDGFLKGLGDVFAPLQRTIEQSGVRTTVSILLLASACAAMLTYWVVRIWTHTPMLAIVMAAIAAMVPFFYVRYRQKKRLLKLEEQFPEAIDLISRALRAGHAFTTGLAMVAEEIPKPLGPELKHVFDQQNYGLPLGDALKDLTRRVPILDVKFFVTAVLTQREAGGNLAEVLDNLASIIRDRFRVKRQVRVIAAHGRLTGFILAALPPSLATALFIMSPKNFGILLKDPLGIQMIIVAISLQMIGVLIIRRIINIEY